MSAKKLSKFMFVYNIIVSEAEMAVKEIKENYLCVHPCKRHFPEKWMLGQFSGIHVCRALGASLFDQWQCWPDSSRHCPYHE